MMIIRVNVEMNFDVGFDTDDEDEAKELAIDLIEEAIKCISVIDPIDYDSDATFAECDSAEFCAYEVEDDE